MNVRRPTVYDVAERANVSIASVSFAYSRPDQIGKATRERILQAAREIGYIPSASARGLARGRTGALGLHSFDLLLDRPQLHVPRESHVPSDTELTSGACFIPWDDSNDEVLADPRAFPLYVDEVQRGFELECRAHNRPVLLSSDAATSVSESAGRVDGLAIFPGDSPSTSLAEVSLNMPIVLFSTESLGDRHHRVVADNDGGMRQLVAHLVRDHHITNIGFVGALRGTDYRERFSAYQRTLTELGIASPDNVFDDTFLGEGRGFPAVIEALRSGTLPQALVCASDQLALALLDLLTAEGIRVPHDVILTGFDGIFAGRLSTPTITTVRQPMEAMGRAAAKLLIDSPRRTQAAEPTVLTLGTKLIIRESCGCSPT